MSDPPRRGTSPDAGTRPTGLAEDDVHPDRRDRRHPDRRPAAHPEVAGGGLRLRRRRARRRLVLVASSPSSDLVPPRRPRRPRLVPSAGFPSPSQLRVQLGAGEDGDVEDPQPEQEDDEPAERPVHGPVVGEARHVVVEGGGRHQPDRHGERAADRQAMDAPRAGRRGRRVQEADEHHGRADEQRPAREVVGAQGTRADTERLGQRREDGAAGDEDDGEDGEHGEDQQGEAQPPGQVEQERAARPHLVDATRRPDERTNVRRR